MSHKSITFKAKIEYFEIVINVMANSIVKFLFIQWTVVSTCANHFITARKRSCGKVMFLDLSVSVLLWIKGWLWVWGCASGSKGYTPPGQKPQSTPSSHTPLDTHTPVHIPQTHTPLDTPITHPLETHRTHAPSTSGRYASCWNAFLFGLLFYCSICEFFCFLLSKL